MRRILWKEWRERWWWAVPWALAVLGVSLFAHGQVFCGESGVSITPWHALSWVPALLCGLAAYAPESRQARALFLFSRPAPWQLVLLGKVLFGLAVAVGVPLLAALCMKLGGPAPYRAFITPATALAGAWTIIWPHSLIYLFGLACSTLLPGMAGGMLTLAGVVSLLAGVVAGLLDIVAPLLPLHYSNAVFYLLLTVGLLAVLTAGVPLARFGLTLPVPARLTRFTLRLGLVLVVGLGVGIPAASLWGEELLCRRVVTDALISPHGTYAITFPGRVWPHFGYLNLTEYRESPEVSFLRRADGKALASMAKKDEDQYNPPFDMMSWHWTCDDLAYCRATGMGEDIMVFTPERGLTTIALTTYSYREMPSPNGRYLPVIEYSIPDFKRIHKKIDPVGVQNWSVLDLRTGRIIPTTLRVDVNSGDQVRWRSDTELEWPEYTYSPKAPGKRYRERTLIGIHVVRVVP